MPTNHTATGKIRPHPTANDTPDAPRPRKRRSRPLVADAKRLARLLGIGVRTIRRMDSAGQIPAPVKLASRTVWVLAEIRAWLAAGAPDRQTWARMRRG